MSAPLGLLKASVVLSRVELRVPRWDVDLDLVLRGLGKALVILAAAYLARWAVHRLSHRIEARAVPGDPLTRGHRVQRATTLAQLLRHVAAIVIAIVTGLLVLDIFINIGPLLAGAGVLGLAVSLGFQNVMKDIITGFLIVLEDQYVVGDRVRIGEVEGTVHQLTLRATVVRDDAGALHYLANGSLTAVANLSRRPGPAGAAGQAPR
ncbi:MAG TPA: mechanosensitive ion channel domain-containing protein [Gemmatimonadales bacterium]|nr:mechanosensitive ion channel domain-containing protein [Gemmatimonadales bacterium]